MANHNFSGVYDDPHHPGAKFSGVIDLPEPGILSANGGIARALLYLNQLVPDDSIAVVTYSIVGLGGIQSHTVHYGPGDRISEAFCGSIPYHSGYVIKLR